MSYYVSVIDGRRSGLLLGPFNTHGAALGQVERVRVSVTAQKPEASFYGFGTSHLTNSRRPGLLNARFDHEEDHLP